jgi:hypothetical protein
MKLALAYLYICMALDIVHGTTVVAATPVNHSLWADGAARQLLVNCPAVYICWYGGSVVSGLCTLTTSAITGSFVACPGANICTVPQFSQTSCPTAGGIYDPNFNTCKEDIGTPTCLGVVLNGQCFSTYPILRICAAGWSVNPSGTCTRNLCSGVISVCNSNCYASKYAQFTQYSCYPADGGPGGFFCGGSLTCWTLACNVGSLIGPAPYYPCNSQTGDDPCTSGATTVCYHGTPVTNLQSVCTGVGGVYTPATGMCTTGQAPTLFVGCNPGDALIGSTCYSPTAFTCPNGSVAIDALSCISTTTPITTLACPDGWSPNHIGGCIAPGGLPSTGKSQP